MNKPSKRRDARIERLEKAIACVELSGRCTAATMRSALTADEWEGYKASAATLFGPVLMGTDKTWFARYKQCLRRGDAIYARAMKLSLVGPQAMRRQRLARNADREYGAAWENLEQLLAENAFVQVLLDRPFGECSPAREDMARPLGSTSEFAVQDGHSSQLALLRCQRSTLSASLSRLLQNDIEGDRVEQGGDEATALDAMFGFADHSHKLNTSSIDDASPIYNDASLPSGV